MKEESEFMKSMNAGFDLVPAIKLISECESIFALESLKKVIDSQINKLNLKG